MSNTDVVSVLKNFFGFYQIEAFLKLMLFMTYLKLNKHCNHIIKIF